MKKETGYYEKRDKQGNLEVIRVGNKKRHIQDEKRYKTKND